MEKWQNRYTVRKFDTSVLVENEHITHLKNMFEHIPTQESINNNLWITLTSKHRDIKKWLLENVYNHKNNGNREYMIQIITAPVVFISNLFLTDNQPISYNDTVRNIGLAAGILMEESLSLGYDVATIGCTENYSNTLQPIYNDIINAKFKEKIVDHTKHIEYQLIPNLAVCIGKGEPLSLNNTWNNYKGYHYIPWQKSQKKWSGII